MRLTTLKTFRRDRHCVTFGSAPLGWITWLALRPRDRRTNLSEEYQALYRPPVPASRPAAAPVNRPNKARAQSTIVEPVSGTLVLLMAPTRESEGTVLFT